MIKIGPVGLLILSFIAFAVAAEIESNTITAIGAFCLLAAGIMAVITLKSDKGEGDEETRNLDVAAPEESGKVGLGGWLSVFIANVSIWTLLCCLGSLSILAIFVSGDYSSNAGISSFILVGLLSLYLMVVFSLGVWLLGLLTKRRKIAIKVGKIFSIITLGLLWIPYLYESRRVKNTLVR